jgi:long-chain acyl-CoA synthetase
VELCGREGWPLDTLVELLETSSEAFGANPALLIKPSFRYLVWSYVGLWNDSGRVASFLQDKGVKKGDRILLWGPNMPQWVLGFFGALRAGAVPVPLDIRSAPDFVSRVVEQTEPRLAFVSGASQQTAPGDLLSGLISVPIEDLDQQVVGFSTEPTAVNVEPDDLAEIMFTSGTTGDPKGVTLTHRNIVSNALAVQRIFPSSTSDRHLSLLPLSHMLEQCGGLLVPLMGGSRIVYPVSRQPSLLFKVIRENQITLLLMVPQGLQLIMNGIEREVERQEKGGAWRAMHRVAPRIPMVARRRMFGSVHKSLGGRLRCIFSGGAFLEPDLARKWENLGIPVVEGYGATEASPAIAFNSLSRRVLGSVGRSLPGQEVRIAQDGEVLVRGPNVTPGYWRNEQATKAAFEEEWYKTGDLGYLDDSGQLYLRGRKKDLIVLANGQNVYPEDIERLLNAHPAVTEGVVVGLPAEGGGGETVHAVLLVNEPQLSGDVIEEVNGNLADHQRISGYTVWHQEDFPRTPTLKVKKALVLDHLKEVASQSSESAAVAPKAAPSTQIDPLFQLVGQVAQVPLTAVQPEKTFGSDLGLDSLGRVELLSMVEQELGVYIDESLLGPSTTVGELQLLVAQQAQAKGVTLSFYRWPLTAWCINLREAIHHAFIFPWMSTMYRAQASGLENLHSLKSPVLFAINHNAIQWDSLLVLKHLPRRWRRRMAYAAAAEITFGKRWLGILASLLGNAFPLSRDTAIRPSLEYIGSLLDRGWNVGIFPEGAQYVGQEMLPFQTGTGLLAVDCRIPVVPVLLVNQGRPSRRWFGLPGREAISVRIGRPLVFSPTTTYAEATEQIEEAVRSL